MIPREKAKDLIIKFIGHCSYIDFGNKNLDSVLLNNAKQCALIAVDLVLIDCRLDCTPYWNEVKEEINKL